MTSRWAMVLGALAVLSTSTGARAQSAPPATGSQIHPGDVIKLTIWREPDLTGAFTVSPEGVVVFPKIGPRSVTGQSVEALREAILAEYAKYLTHQSIQIDVQRKVQVLGAVREPGVYNVDPTMTISDALALAGGVTPEGRPDRVQLRRNDEVVQLRLLGRTPLADAPIRSGDQLFVPERSYVERNTSLIAALVSGSIALLIAVATR